MANKKTEEQAIMWLNRFVGGDDILDSINAKAVLDLIRDQKAEIGRLGRIVNALKSQKSALLAELHEENEYVPWQDNEKEFLNKWMNKYGFEEDP